MVNKILNSEKKINLRKKLLQAHIKLMESGLVLSSFGNISVRCRENNSILIKPSGVHYRDLTGESMVEVDLDSAKCVNSKFKPSTDTPTHVELYRAFKDCNAVLHMHSEYCTIFAQSGKNIKCTGTTHADYFFGDIPCTRSLSSKEIKSNYEKNTGLVIIEEFKNKNPMEIPAVLVLNHGPFVWANSIDNILNTAIMLEYIAKIQFKVDLFGLKENKISQSLIEKHYLRKHGDDSYYGQK